MASGKTVDQLIIEIKADTRQLKRELKDIQNSKPAICVSTGWLVKADKKVHILMSDYNYDDKGELADGGNSTVIPSTNVIKKYKIEGL